MNLDLNAMIQSLLSMCVNIYNATLQVLTYHVDINIDWLGINLDFTLWQAFITSGGAVLFGLLIYKVVRWLTI